MRVKLLAAIALSLCVTQPARAQSQFQVFASVVDAAGTPVTALALTDLRVQEGGVEARVVSVEPINWPVKLQLLVDNGPGLGGPNLQILRDGMRGLLNALPEGVEVTIVTTAPQPRFLVRATTDRKALIDGIGRVSPDESGSRFVESLQEATQRIERDKTDHFPVIVSVTSGVGDFDVLERDVNRIFERLRRRPMTVHVVLLSMTRGGALIGANQTQVGMAVTEYTRGRYENIAAATRLNSLLPELGQQVAAGHEKQSHQFRLTVERPAGVKGDVGQVSAGARPGLVLRGLSMDGRHD